MSRIRGKNTRPERKVRSRLASMGVKGFKTGPRILGRPDITFEEAKIAVFIDGCFWHKCPVHYSHPLTRQKFWESKISSNVARDRKVNMSLSRRGWKVLRYWEHEVTERPDGVASAIRLELARRLGVREDS